MGFLSFQTDITVTLIFTIFRGKKTTKKLFLFVALKETWSQDQRAL